MPYPIVSKREHPSPLPPNLQDYDLVHSTFSWEQAREKLAGMGEGKLNIGFEAVDRHRGTETESHVALRFLSKDDKAEPQDISYGQLLADANRFANVLATLGVKRGDRVYCLSGRTPGLYIAALGTLKHGCTFTPLFSAFGPEPIRSRMDIGQPSVLVTTAKLYRKKLADWAPELPYLNHVILLDDEPPAPSGKTVGFSDLMNGASPEYSTQAMAPDEPALLHFTSGTTGKPKGALHVHQAVLAHYITAEFALDLQPGDIYWCTADPGWVTGTSYGIIAPLIHGVTMIVDEADFDAERWYRILQDQHVSVWYTAPTAIRMLMKYGKQMADRFDLSDLRFLASVGEPLNPEAVKWGMETFGLPFHDNWWQTETGGIMIANISAMDIKPGSMGKPLPGIQAAIAHRTPDGIEFIETPDETGELVLKTGWPSMFRGYLNEEERYRKCFVGDWYLSGDLARCDADGYFWFVGRADDVIKSSGHLIGPFEVESIFMEHPAVAEAGVIGVPDEVSGEAVKAFVALKPGFEGTEVLQKELLGLARKRLGPAVAPKTLEFRPTLPKTRSGKIMRRLLKARELGLPEGDISTLEESGK
ncbi:acetate--CoA ligase [Marinobacter sp.]|uniref:acetate--CoA ligase n=1 Tax=Marinobacter sp. TaxID=50741 RepID=UPI00384B249E